MLGQFFFLDVVTIFIVAIFFLILGYRPPWWFTKKATNCINSDVSIIPGPYTLPILGTRWVFSVGGYKFEKIHEFYKEMYCKYGPVVKEEALFNVPVISVFEKSDIEKVCRSSGKYPIRPPTEAVAHYRRNKPERYASTGLVNEQGETWHFLRTSLTTNLTSPKTISSFLPLMEEIAEDWCYLIKQKRDETGLIADMETVAGRLGLEATCALVLGRRMGFLIPGGETSIAQKLSQAVHENFEACRDTYYGLPLWKLFPTPCYKKLANSEDRIYELALELIKSADESTKESVIFQSIIGAKIDDREKTAALVDFIASGIHTLKNSLLFLLYQISQNLTSQQKIIEDDSPNKGYLKACVTETFRISPTANCLARVTQDDLELSGYKLKAGSVVICHNGIACHDERNFKNAKEFRPERWLGDGKLETAANATFLVTPFGVGKRICPGKRFIEQVLPIILEKTVRYFVIESHTPMELQFEFLLAPKAPISMTMCDRI